MSELYIANESAVVAGVNGQPVYLSKGDTTVAADDPIRKKYPHFFEPMTPNADHTPKQSQSPGEQAPEKPAPRAAKKAAAK